MSEEINPEAGNEAESDVSSEQEQVVDADTSPAREGMDAEKVRGIVEAILMTSDSPVTPGKLQALIKGVNGRDLRQAVDDLNESYREGGHAMSITEVAGGFQVVTRKEFGPWVRKFHDHSQIRLSQAALETLSIVAFKQPVTRIEVDSVRGVDSGGVLRTLMELNMIRLVGRSEGVGRPHLFGTTRDFMTHFGLRSLADLPKPRELEELLAEGERKAQENGTALAPSSPPEDGLPIEGEAVELSPDDDADESESADGVADVDWDDDADATDDPAPDDDRR